MRAFLFLTFLFLFSYQVNAQVGIRTTNPQGALDITSTTDGLLIPRVALTSTAAVLPVITATESELVYNTAIAGDVTPGYYYLSSATGPWVRLFTGASTGWLTTGNSGIIDGTNYMGTDASTDVDVAFRRRNAAAGKIGTNSTSFGVGALNVGAATTSTAFGTNALKLNTVDSNVAFGNGALAANTTGINNTAVGTGALAVNSTVILAIKGDDNTALGFQSLNKTTVGKQNTAVGSGALAANNSATGSTAVGSSALLLSTGSSNVALGVSAGSAITTGSSNIMIGANTVAPVATASSQLNIGNTLFGNMAGVLTSGVNTTRTIGINVLSPQGALDITSSDNGFLIPRISLTSGTADPLPLTTPTTSEIIYNTNTIGNVTPGFYFWDSSAWVRFNTGAATGWLTTGNTVGAAGTFMGTLDNFDVSFRRFNTAAGFIGTTNTAFGVTSLAANSGTNNTAFGTNALAANNTPGDNTAIGFNALAANTLNSGAGNLNTAVGSGALDSLNGGARNTAVGANALTGVSTNASLDNVAVGWNALQGSGTIDQSVAIGAGALLNSGGGTTRSTAIGYNAGNAMTQSIENVIIGWSAQGTGATARNQIAIGAGATASADNAVRLGNTAITYAGIQVGWTVTSDRRWKDTIKDSGLGLDFLKTLRPVSYIRNNDAKGKTEYGFIAQELEEAFNKVGDSNNGVISKDEKGMLGVRYNDFISITVKAVQEQQAEIEALKKANEDLQKTNAAILKRLEALEKK